MNETEITTAPEMMPEQNTGYSAVSIWTDTKSLSSAWKAAKFLSSSDLVPDNYRGRPENCLVAVDIAGRLNVSPLMVMQNLFVVRGKPGWSGSFCAAAVNGCGRFSPLEYVTSDDDGGSCYAQATRKADGKTIKGATVSLQMAMDEGWTTKPGSKWRTMPELMLQYRAAAFFARAHCPDVLLGLQTADELADVRGSDPGENVVRFTMTEEGVNGD